jgi:Dolichyl-phosphate-mannose-protein mannosyltransferase
VVTTAATHNLNKSDTYPRADLLYLAAIAGTVVVVHLLTNSRYGFHRDELQFLSDARHLDWGFVAYPPFTPVVERVSLAVFGLSLVGLRLFSVLSQAFAIVFTGLMTRELGGGRLAQIAAAIAVALSPVPLFEGTEFQYSSFDYLWWVLIAYFMVRLLKTGNARWWLAVGAIAGIGFMTKYSILFLVAGVICGLLLTQARHFFANRWFWAGAALTLLIFLPNLIWQVRHGFVSLHFLQHIHARDVAQGRTNGFISDQFMVCTNPASALLWIPGLICFFRSSRYRLLGWMYIVPLVFFILAKGRGYYLAGAYPMLMAMGASMAERWLVTLPHAWSRTLKTVFFTGLALCGAYMCAVILPLASAGRLRDFALENNDDLREEFGWNELVRTVASIRDALPPEQQKQIGILVGNYGEQGAIEILGTRYNLPAPISGTNSGWLRGYPVPPPSTLIVLGLSRSYVEQTFTSCGLAGHNGNDYGIRNEESQFHPDIFLCAGPRLPWPEFWKTYQHFG